MKAAFVFVFVAMAVLVVVIGSTHQPAVLGLAAVALFGVVLLLGPVPTGDRARHRGAGAAVHGGDPAGAAVDGRPNPGGAR